jgi:hypothetical protein
VAGGFWARLLGRREPQDRRFSCTGCGAAVTLQQVTSQGSLCAKCWRDAASRKSTQKLAFKAGLANGSIYWPSGAEFANARNLDGVLTSRRWQLESEVYRDGQTFEQELAKVDAGGEARLILRCENESSVEGSYLVLEVKGAFGACFYLENMDSPIFFAHTRHAASGQIELDEQLWYCCPCCAVSMGSVPSRFHLSREEARAVILAAWNRAPQAADLRWMQVEDIYLYSPGEG